MRCAHKGWRAGRRSRHRLLMGSIGPDHGCHGALLSSGGVKVEEAGVRKNDGTEVYISIIQSQNAAAGVSQTRPQPHYTRIRSGVAGPRTV